MGRREKERKGKERKRRGKTETSVGLRVEMKKKGEKG